ncbi:MAG TPA: TerC family protein [Mycobacteriales bacterium]|nr:TerC family protein [Mycobacteriales bacterium]
MLAVESAPVTEASLGIPLWVWLATVLAVLAVISFDLLHSTRRPHVPSLKEATAWSLVYVVAALVFCVGLLVVVDGRIAAEFLGGYITEKALSVDNLFVFVIIMTTFAVPPKHQQKVLMIGILLALVLRGIFIAVGAAAISAFSEVFYLFGAFLLYTAVQLARHRGEEPDLENNKILDFAQRRLSTTKEYDEAKIRTVVDGKRVFTPMAIVLVAIGTTDLLFALDSIPAIFGITQEPYLVFTANAFALMGLRQLYFLVNGLLDRLVYLSIGLSVILGFIGVKLILHALHENGIDLGFVGEGAWALLPEIGIGTSLTVIAITLAITTVASLRAVKRHPEMLDKPGIHNELGEALEQVPDDTRR